MEEGARRIHLLEASTAPGPLPAAAAQGWLGKVLYQAVRQAVRGTARVVWHLRVEGAEKVPAHGPAILATNHISFVDSPVVMAAVPRRACTLGKAEYLARRRTRWLFTALGMIPIDRTSRSSARRALGEAAEVLRCGECVAVFPEGTRSRSGELHRGRTGVAHLALATNAPIVPIAVIGTDRVLRPGATVPRPLVPVTVRIGSPIDPTTYPAGGSRQEVRRRLTNDVMARIAALSGQDYVDRYAPIT